MGLDSILGPLATEYGLNKGVVSDLNVGILYIFAISSLGVYGVVLGGWASNNKYSLLGGIRAGAQMISYELGLSLSVVGVLLLAGSLSLVEIVEAQDSIWKWYVFRQPLGFILFLIAGSAEIARTPFDLIECENELVAGYQTEYSSMKFGLFYLGEYAHLLFLSALMTTLYFGGWQGPCAAAHFLVPGQDVFLCVPVRLDSRHVSPASLRSGHDIWMESAVASGTFQRDGNGVRVHRLAPVYALRVSCRREAQLRPAILHKALEKQI